MSLERIKTSLWERYLHMVEDGLSAFYHSQKSLRTLKKSIVLSGSKIRVLVIHFGMMKTLRMEGGRQASEVPLW